MQRLQVTCTFNTKVVYPFLARKWGWPGNSLCWRLGDSWSADIGWEFRQDFKVTFIDLKLYNLFWVFEQLILASCNILTQMHLNGTLSWPNHCDGREWTKPKRVILNFTKQLRKSSGKVWFYKIFVYWWLQILSFYISEKNYFLARFHFMHSPDGRNCAKMLVELHVARGFSNEIDLFITQAVLQWEMFDFNVNINIMLFYSDTCAYKTKMLQS